MAEDFNSKYSGEQVEQLLDQVASGNTGGGGVAVETDPIFSASAAATITAEKIAEWDGKVDKVNGKQLSTEDFTTILKQKLDGLSNYDDTTISQAVEKLRTDLDALVSGDTTTAIKTFNEVIAFLDGISDTEDLSSIIASIEQQIAGKMDSVTLAKVATSGSYNDLTNKPTIPAEQVNADWNATSGKAKILNKPTIPSAVTESTVSGWGFTKNTGTYSKPSTGIPKTDLASEVQNSLEKAGKSVQYNGDGQAVIQNGTIYDGNGGVLYAFPSADDDAKENADFIIATDGELSGKQDKINDLDKIRSGAAKGASSTQQETLQTGASAVVVPDGVLVDGGGSTYALPDIDETTKEASDYVLASEEYVDSKVGSGGGGSKVFVEVAPSLEPMGYHGGLQTIAPNNVYVFTKPIVSLLLGGITESDSKGDEYSIMFTASQDNIQITLSPGNRFNIYWANGVVPIISSGDLCELSLVRIGNDIKAVLTPFKAV